MNLLIYLNTFIYKYIFTSFYLFMTHTYQLTINLFVKETFINQSECFLIVCFFVIFAWTVRLILTKFLVQGKFTNLNILIPYAFQYDGLYNKKVMKEIITKLIINNIHKHKQSYINITIMHKPVWLSFLRGTELKQLWCP